MGAASKQEYRRAHSQAYWGKEKPKKEWRRFRGTPHPFIIMAASLGCVSIFAAGAGMCMRHDSVPERPKVAHMEPLSFIAP